MKARSVLIVGILLGVTLAFAGTTGKIRGVAKDAQTSVLLPGVNVVITHVWQENRETSVKSEFGAATSIDGEFIILNVPPGTYSLTATMLGYAPLTQQRVQVNVDRTSTVNFSLTQKVLEGGEVVVTATKDLIQLDVAATENYVSAEQYQNTPFANRIEDILGLQSGVSGNIIEGEIQMRAGETREVSFLLDGMSMVDKKFNRPVMPIQPGMVQEIKIMRNGFNAEYGQSRSGVINVVSKNPSNDVHFSIDYQFDPANRPHSGRSIYDTDYRWEWRLLAGPMAYDGGEITLAEGREGIKKNWIGWNKYSQNLLNDKNPNNDLTADEAFELWKWQHRPIDYGNRNGHNVDVTLSSKLPLVPWNANFMLGGKYEYHPFSFPQSRTHYDERLSSAKIVNQLSNTMKLTLNSIYSEVRSVTQGNSTSSWSEEDRLSYSGGDYQTYYPFYKPTIDRYTTLVGAKLTHAINAKMYYEVNLSHFYVKWHMGRGDSATMADGRTFHGRLYYDPQSGWIPKDKGADDIASGYRMYGGGYTWDDSYNRRTSLNSALTYQFHPAHELKTGFEFNYDILRENRVHWHNEDSTQEFLRRFKAKPYEVGLFVQDKIEFQGMVANVGLRFDYFNTNTDVADIHKSLTYGTNRDIWEAFTNGTYPTTRAKPKYYFSPRIGISHPLSERSKIYFNFGHFVQTPPTMGLYRTEVDGAMPRMQWISDPDLPLEKTIAYELGYDMGISDYFQLHVGAFYKDYFDVSSGMVYAHSDQSLVIEWPAHNNYAEIRGVEIELRKTAGRFLNGWLNYNYIKRSEANLEIPNLSQIPIITDDPMIGRNGVLWGVPRSNIINIQPNARGVVTFSVPRDWGPRLSGYPFLQNTNLSLQLYYQSGARLQHPRSSFRDLHPDVYFHELDKYWANLRLSRLFTPGRMNIEAYMDISNILHTKYRSVPGGTAGEDYYDDLFASGRLNEVGTDKVSDPLILRTESDNVYWATLKEVVLGIRIHF